MPLKTRQQGAATIIQIQGRLDTTNFAVFETEANALLGNGSTTFVFDCAELSYVSSAGLRALLSLRKRSHTMGIRMRLCQLQPSVRQVFEISGFTDIFDIHGTVEESLH